MCAYKCRLWRPADLRASAPSTISHPVAQFLLCRVLAPLPLPCCSEYSTCVNSLPPTLRPVTQVLVSATPFSEEEIET